jgi:hypothetical protein
MQQLSHSSQKDASPFSMPLRKNYAIFCLRSSKFHLNTRFATGDALHRFLEHATHTAPSTKEHHMRTDIIPSLNTDLAAFADRLRMRRDIMQKQIEALDKVINIIDMSSQPDPLPSEALMPDEKTALPAFFAAWVAEKTHVRGKDGRALFHPRPAGEAPKDGRGRPMLWDGTIPGWEDDNRTDEEIALGDTHSG